jgi:predicted RND superfamily exporter protein
MIEKVAAGFEKNNPGTEILFHGIPVNAADNSRQIKEDVLLTIGISLIIICIIFGIVFRNKSTLPLLLAPIAWGTMFALSCLYWIQGTISLLAMGIGAVILGVALSYCLHVITHYKYVSKPEKVLKDQSSPVVLGCLTTVGAFVALLFTDSSLLRDFGIFATLSILGTVFFSLVFTPQFLKPERNKIARKIFKTLDKINDYPFDRKIVLRWLLVVICGVCIWGSSKVGFDCNLRNIGYLSDVSIHSREVYSDKFNDGNLSLYFATFADSRDQALENTAILTHALDSMKQKGKVCSYMDISQIFVPEKEQQKRLEAWNAYWTPMHIDAVRANVEAAAKDNLGGHYYEGMFNPFFESITKEDYEIGSLYDLGLIPEELVGNFIDEASGKFLVMTSAVMPEDCLEDVSIVLNDIPEVVVVDPNFYATELVKVVNNDFNKVLGISSVFVFIVLLLSFRSIVLALIAFIPMSVSWYVVKGVMGLIGMDFNMINIVIATFIFGVGVDYSIFVMKGLLAKERGEDNRLLIQHKAAILLSAFMLIMALGSLLFATHPAISSIGFTTLIGMSSTVLLTYTIQPALFRFMTKFDFFKRIIK